MYGRRFWTGWDFFRRGWEMEFQHTYCAYLRWSLDDCYVRRIIECLLLMPNLFLSQQGQQPVFLQVNNENQISNCEYTFIVGVDVHKPRRHPLGSDNNPRSYGRPLWHHNIPSALPNPHDTSDEIEKVGHISLYEWSSLTGWSHE